MKILNTIFPNGDLWSIIYLVGILRLTNFRKRSGSILTVTLPQWPLCFSLKKLTPLDVLLLDERRDRDIVCTLHQRTINWIAYKRIEFRNTKIPNADRKVSYDFIQFRTFVHITFQFTQQNRSCTLALSDFEAHPNYKFLDCHSWYVPMGATVKAAHSFCTASKDFLIKISSTSWNV